MSDQDLILERLASIEEKLDRVAAVEKRLDDFARPWDSLADLGKDLSLLMSPSVKLLTEELAEVETGFQLEDILAMVKRLLLSFRHLTWSLEQLENLIDWWQDLEPLLKVAVPHLIDKLDDLEQKGIFRINKAVHQHVRQDRRKLHPRRYRRHGRRLCPDARHHQKIVRTRHDRFPGTVHEPACPDQPGRGQTHRSRRSDVQDDE